MDSIQESVQSNEFSEWLRSSNLTEYAEKFSENGFDDIDLLKSMDEGEITSMIEDIGIEKRGHIMKIKKCLNWLKAPVTQTVSVNTRPNVPKTLKQTTLMLRKGQFVFERQTTAVPPCPWQKLLKPHPKTDKMRFYNDVTREIYESAYVPLQTRFASYLNGQQQFRWDVTEKIKKLEAVLTSYEEGLIPKDNIMIKRYLEMPTDPTLKDLSHAGRAMEHIKPTCAKSDELLEMLKKRNQELYNEENEVKQWAENEAEVIHGYISTMKGLKEKLVCFEDNLKFVTTSRKKKFSSSDISTYEIQRKRKRRKEQKSKNKKKNRISLVRNTRKFLSDNNFAWDAIDRICPNSYGEKSLETIKLEDLQNVPEGEHDPVILQNIAYLKFIGSLDTDEDVQEVLFNSDHSYEEDSSDSSDNCDM
jgi:hypothetical protein